MEMVVVFIEKNMVVFASFQQKKSSRTRTLWSIKIVKIAAD